MFVYISDCSRHCCVPKTNRSIWSTKFDRVQSPHCTSYLRRSSNTVGLCIEVVLSNNVAVAVRKGVTARGYIIKSCYTDETAGEVDPCQHVQPNIEVLWRNFDHLFPDNSCDFYMICNIRSVEAPYGGSLGCLLELCIIETSPAATGSNPCLPDPHPFISSLYTVIQYNYDGTKASWCTKENVSGFQLEFGHN